MSKAKMDHLAHCAVAASEAGMSYGNYMAAMQSKTVCMDPQELPPVDVWAVIQHRVPVLCRSCRTGVTTYYGSLHDAAEHGFREPNISLCLSGEQKTHHGCTWSKATAMDIYRLDPALQAARDDHGA